MGFDIPGMMGPGSLNPFGGPFGGFTGVRSGPAGQYGATSEIPGVTDSKTSALMDALRGIYANTAIGRERVLNDPVDESDSMNLGLVPLAQPEVRGDFGWANRILDAAEQVKGQYAQKPVGGGGAGGGRSASVAFSTKGGAGGPIPEQKNIPQAPAPQFNDYPDADPRRNDLIKQLQGQRPERDRAQINVGEAIANLLIPAAGVLAAGSGGNMGAVAPVGAQAVQQGVQGILGRQQQEQGRMDRESMQDFNIQQAGTKLELEQVMADEQLARKRIDAKNAAAMKQFELQEKANEKERDRLAKAREGALNRASSERGIKWKISSNERIAAKKAAAKGSTFVNPYEEMNKSITKNKDLLNAVQVTTEQALADPYITNGIAIIMKKAPNDPAVKEEIKRHLKNARPNPRYLLGETKGIDSNFMMMEDEKAAAKAKLGTEEPPTQGPLSADNGYQAPVQQQVQQVSPVVANMAERFTIAQLKQAPAMNAQEEAAKQAAIAYRQQKGLE